MTAGEELRQAITLVALRWGAPTYDKAEELADAVLAVPAIADALRDAALLARVREMVGDGFYVSSEAEDCVYAIADLLGDE